MTNDIFKVFTNVDIPDRKSLYEFVFKKTLLLKTGITKEDFLDKVYWREDLGSIEIFPEVILPHFESEKLQSSQVMIVRPINSVKEWSSKIESVKLIIVILVKPQNHILTLKTLMKHLADDSFIQLLESKTKIEIENKLRSVLCK